MGKTKIEDFVIWKFKFFNYVEDSRILHNKYFYRSTEELKEEGHKQNKVTYDKSFLYIRHECNKVCDTNRDPNISIQCPKEKVFGC